ncbi:MAG: hypothetical protein KDB23_32820 [Planctomycetales bacterium]|nr:hypothetical protein [Planctomycetales bacterium]
MSPTRWVLLRLVIAEIWLLFLCWLYNIGFFQAFFDWSVNRVFVGDNVWPNVDGERREIDQMNQRSLAILIFCVASGELLFATMALLVFWTRRGKIRRSPLATRREKNMRHLMTFITLVIAASCSAVFVLADIRLGRLWVFGSAVFAFVILPIRTVIIETGLRRVG